MLILLLANFFSNNMPHIKGFGLGSVPKDSSLYSHVIFPSPGKPQPGGGFSYGFRKPMGAITRKRKRKTRDGYMFV